MVVTVDGQAVPNWYQALQKLLGPGKYKFSESTMSHHILSAGESMDALVPHDFDNSPLSFEKSGQLWSQLNEARARVAVEICYCSTLGECWTLHSGANDNSTTETRTCPSQTAATFQQ